MTWLWVPSPASLPTTLAGLFLLRFEPTVTFRLFTPFAISESHDRVAPGIIRLSNFNEPIVTFRLFVLEIEVSLTIDNCLKKNKPSISNHYARFQSVINEKVFVIGWKINLFSFLFGRWASLPFSLFKRSSNDLEIFPWQVSFLEQ